MLGGAIYTVAKWFAGRQRPVVGIRPYDFDPFINGLRGFVGAENMSFPSGHATLAFATAACLAINVPRLAILFYVAAAGVAVERVAENAYYFSDVVVGAGVGTLSAYVVHWVGQSLHERESCNELRRLTSTVAGR